MEAHSNLSVTCNSVEGKIEKILCGNSFYLEHSKHSMTAVFPYKGLHVLSIKG